jgi:hypothetical protein
MRLSFCWILLAVGCLPSSSRDEGTEIRGDREQVLDQIVRDVLTNPDLNPVRQFYSTPNDSLIGLSTDSTVPWPVGYMPKVDGFQFVFLNPENKERSMPRKLGITIHRFVFPPVFSEDLKNADPTPISVGYFNIGGSANGGADGGCHVSYKVRLEGKSWIVEYNGRECQ